MENRWHARVFHVAARSTSGFVCFSRITLVFSFSRYCIARFFHSFSRGAESRGTKETRTREGYDRRFLKYLTRYFILVVSVRSSFSFSSARKLLIAMERVHRIDRLTLEWFELFRGRIVVGWKFESISTRRPIFFRLSLGYSLVSFRQHG